METVYFVIILLANAFNLSLPSDVEKSLLKNLLKDYDIHSSPTVKNGGPLVVKTSIDSLKLIGYDTESHQATFGLRVYLDWTDPGLLWNSNNYDKLTELSISSKSVWQPDFRLTDGESSNAYPSFDTYARVDGDGLVYITPYLKATTICHVEKNASVSCTLNFGSLNLQQKLLVFELYNGNSSTLNSFEQYDGSPIDLKSVKIEIKSNVSFDCCPNEMYSRVQITVEAQQKQKNNFLAFAFVPMFIFTFLILLQFLIPPNIGERVVYGILVIILIVIYGYYICTISLAWDYGLFNLSVAYVFCMTLGAASALTNTCLVVNFHHARHNLIMPTWMKRIFLRYLPPILLMPDEGERLERDVSSKRQSTKRVEPKSILDLESEQPLLTDSAGANASQNETPVRMAERRRLLLTGAELLRAVRDLTYGVNVRLAEVRGHPQWVYAARVVNRLGLATLTVYFLLCHGIVLIYFWIN